MAIRALAGTGFDTTSTISRTTWAEYYAGPSGDFTRVADGFTGLDLPIKGGVHASITTAFVQQVKVFPTQVAGESVAAVVYQNLL